MAGIGRAAGNAALAKASSTLGLAEASQSGRTAAQAAFRGVAGASSSEAASATATETPAWVHQLRQEQAARQHRQSTVQTLKEGDGGGASATPDLDEKED